jgi:response regulator RpfG family c-di-GMP phosphodiesterase
MGNKSMQKKILFVDNETLILKALRRLFEDTEFSVRMAENGAEALEMLADENADLIVTDLKMPGMDGYELMRIVREKYPSLIRVVLSGHFDEGMLLKVQRESLARLYLLKPWQNEELLVSIRQLFEVDSMLQKRNLLETINKIGTLPSPSKTYKRFKALVEQDAGMKEIASVLEEDPSVSAKILQIANTAFYGARTGSVKQAITYLGIANISNIVLSANIMDGLNSKTQWSRNAAEIIWKHSDSTNKITMYLHKRILNRQIPDTSAVAGLLHDVGRVVLHNTFVQGSLKQVSSIRNEELYDYFEKSEPRNVTHQEVGERPESGGSRLFPEGEGNEKAGHQRCSCQQSYGKQDHSGSGSRIGRRRKFSGYPARPVKGGCPGFQHRERQV